MRALPLGSASLFETLGGATNNRKIRESAFELQIFTANETPNGPR
jgi:hypothetical protein